MGAFFAKQPNGLYCRFSTVVDCPTHYNMTEQDVIDYFVEEAKDNAKRILEHKLQPFEKVTEYFMPYNMSRDEFEDCLKEMSKDQGVS